MKAILNEVNLIQEHTFETYRLNFKVGPIAVSINASLKTFQLYSEGIYDDKACSSSTVNHAMLLVSFYSIVFTVQRQLNLNAKCNKIVLNSPSSRSGMEKTFGF